jgi:hypothetical protein
VAPLNRGSGAAAMRKLLAVLNAIAKQGSRRNPMLHDA